MIGKHVKTGFLSLAIDVQQSHFCFQVFWLVLFISCWAIFCIYQNWEKIIFFKYSFIIHQHIYSFFFFFFISKTLEKKQDIHFFKVILWHTFVVSHVVHHSPFIGCIAFVSLQAYNTIRYLKRIDSFPFLSKCGGHLCTTVCGHLFLFFKCGDKGQLSVISTLVKMSRYLLF